MDIKEKSFNFTSSSIPQIEIDIGPKSLPIMYFKLKVDVLQNMAQVFGKKMHILATFSFSFLCPSFLFSCLYHLPRKIHGNRAGLEHYDKYCRHFPSQLRPIRSPHLNQFKKYINFVQCWSILAKTCSTRVLSGHSVSALWFKGHTFESGNSKIISWK